MMEPWVDHPYPLLRGSGAILITVGVGVLLGARWREWFVPLFFAAFGLGFASLYLFGLAVPVAAVPALHTWIFFGAVALELVLVIAVLVLFRNDERKLVLWILLAVGLHFVPMAVSHGPLMLALAILLIANAAIALSRERRSVNATLVLDGVAKVAFGAVMLFMAPAWRWPG